MSEDSIEFSLSIAEQRAVGFIPAWSLAFLQLESDHHKEEEHQWDDEALPKF